MGTIVKRDGKHRAIVRRVGYKTQTRQFDTAAEARRWMRTVEASMDDRTYVEPVSMAAHEIFTKFRDEVCPTRKGKKWEVTRINKFLRECAFLQKKVHAVSAADIRTWRNTRLAQVDKASVRREMNLMSSVFSHAIKEWGVVLRVNPCLEVKRPTGNKHRDRRFTQDELTSLREYFKPTTARHPLTSKESTWWAIELGAETAMRVGEICATEWRNVNLEAGWLFIPDSKNGKHRYVPLTPRAREILTYLKGWSSTRVFKTNGAVLGKYFRDACKTLGITNLKFHDTRHEGTTNLASLLDPLDLCKVVGHSDMKQVLTYYNPTPEELAARLTLGLPAQSRVRLPNP